jgi:hypothetical protein
MGLFSKKPAPKAATGRPNDRYRLVSTGQMVTLLRHLPNGEVRIAMDSEHVLRDWIVRADDITPA